MSGVKVVKLSKKYQTNATDLKKEKEKLIMVIQNTFNKFMNESNYNTMEYVMEVLVEDYIYVPSDTILTPGKYIRYLDMKNPLEMKLRIGGFVMNDNGYTVSIKGQDKTFRVSKRNGLFFSQISDNDRIRSAVDEYINN